MKKIITLLSIISFAFLGFIQGAQAYSNFTANTDMVRVAPYAANAAAGADNWSAGNATRNFLNIGQRYRIRQTGSIEQVRFYAGTNASAPNLTEFYVRIWRKNGGTYDMVGESEDLLATMVPGTISTHVLASPIVGVQEGDYIGYKMVGTGGSSMYAVVGGTSNGTTSKYETGADVGASYNFDTAPGSLANIALPIEIYMQAPQASFIGDSIIAGHPAHYSFLEGNTTTNIDSTIEKQFSNLTGYNYQNMGIGSQTTNHTSARFLSDVINKKPKFAVLEGGVNDIAGGAITKAQFLANNTAMLDAMQTVGITALMVKILPWTGGTDPQLTTRDDWNTDLETLVDTYPNAFMVDAGSYVGQFNAAGPANNYWDIQPAYNVGGVHFTQAGHAKIAEAIADVLKPTAIFDNDFAAIEGSQIVVNYNLIQIGDASTQNISQTANSGIEYSTDGGGTWIDASDAGGTSDGFIALAGSQTGIDHDFLWNAEADLGVGVFNNVLLRVRPNDGVSDAMSWINSNTFNVIVLSASDNALVQIGNEGDSPDFVNSIITVAQLHTITPALTGITAGNETVYQDYIDAHPADFATPATQAEVQSMINTVNAQVIANTHSSSTRKSGSKRVSKKRLAEIFGTSFAREVGEEQLTLGKGKLCEASKILHENLKSGSRNGFYNAYTGKTVKEAKILQAHMNRLGFKSGEVDGILGPISDKAIRRMQALLGTKQDGYVGPLTRVLINNSC